jgi:hypothetical protein
MQNVILLREVAAHLDMLEARCGRVGCERHGRPSLKRLVAERGPDASVPAVLRAQVIDCPHRDGRERERCDPYPPELERLFAHPPK